MHDAQRRGTLLGIAAILIWSCTIAVSRSLAESIGAMRAASLMFLGGGALGCAWIAATGRGIGRLRRLPTAYVLGCGSLFVTYMACLYLAIGLSVSRQQTLEVALVNYLWPALTLVLATVLLGLRPGPAFGPGVLLGLAGATLAPLRPGEYSPAALRETLAAHPAPYLFAVAAAALWALYSTLSRKLAAAAEDSGVPLFALAAGAVLGGMAWIHPEPCRWTPRAAGELAFMALLPSLVAYAAWDTGMRRGHVPTIAAMAYFTPLLSTLFSSLYLHVAVGPNVWAGCGLIVMGAWLCQRSAGD